MDILGIGFSELIFIMIIAMMVFGPRRLPEMAAKAGKFVRDMRSMSQGLMAEWQREITVAARLEELQQARQDIEAIKEDLGQTKKELTQAQKDFETETKSVQRSVSSSKTEIEKEMASAKKELTSTTSTVAAGPPAANDTQEQAAETASAAEAKSAPSGDKTDSNDAESVSNTAPVPEAGLPPAEADDEAVLPEETEPRSEPAPQAATDLNDAESVSGTATIPETDPSPAEADGEAVTSVEAEPVATQAPPVAEPPAADEDQSDPSDDQTETGSNNSKSVASKKIKESLNE